MKTLLLSLVVVAFMFLEPGDTLTCRSWNGTVCLGHLECAEGKNQCYQTKIKGDLFGTKTVRGCADSCPIAGENQIVTCCGYDNCNC